MSRIGKKPIKIVDGVEVKIENSLVTVKGPKGTLTRTILSEVIAEIKDGEIHFTPRNHDKKSLAFWGLTRTLVSNMIDGVVNGYEKKLEINGVGFKCKVEGTDLVLDVGYSHQVKVNAPEGITFTTEKNSITVKGIDKELVGQVSAGIRRVKPPEPYKGKGIKYSTEVIRRKVGKKTA
ncbi:MAG: 50S ribosomal protein L6 [Candidatus Pacebacteria bacterium]|nr:50S ribosomal protein L6 [Candidatus Paceibacterota bacterium]